MGQRHRIDFEPVEKVVVELGIEMPIIEQICYVLFDKVDPLVAVTTLLNREPKPEID